MKLDFPIRIQIETEIPKRKDKKIIYIVSLELIKMNITSIKGKNTSNIKVHTVKSMSKLSSKEVTNIPKRGGFTALRGTRRSKCLQIILSGYLTLGS